MPVYSHSRLSTYENCPLQYKLRYLDKIAAVEEGIEAFLGSRFHEVMERLYGDLSFTVHPLDDLLDAYEERWARKFHDDIVVTRKDRTADDYRRMGIKFIRDYYARYAPFDQSRVLGLEKDVTIDLGGGTGYLVKGIIDRLAQAPDGTYEIHDYKTSSGLPEQSKMDEDRQLALYQIGVEGMWPDVRRVRLIWHYVAFDKEIVSERTPGRLAELKTETIALIDEIERDTAFEPHESALCDWCPYWDHCPMKRHIAAIEALPAEEAREDQGLLLVDRYAELDARRKQAKAGVEEVEKELEKLKGAIASYAGGRGASVLQGSAATLRITGRDRILVPNKGEEQRLELEKLIRDAGKWPELSALDPYALEHFIKGGGPGDDLRRAIEPFLAKSRTFTFSLKKNREDD